MNWYIKAQQNDNFKYETDEERTTISSKYGSVVITETTPQYEFVEDLTSEEFNKIKIEDDDFITKIEHIEINPNYRGQGKGTALMVEAMKEANRRNTSYIYLNASPMGFDGLSLGDLTRFYEKFGFKVIKEQGGNNLMGINNELV